MKLSTKTKYGLKAVIDIAVFGVDELVTIKSIAKRHNLSEAYLERIIAPVKKADIIKSTRGSKGGYNLNVDPKKLTLGTILEALEGTRSTCKESCCDDRCDCCVSKFVLEKIDESINNVVNNITLFDLVCEYYELNNIKI